MLPKHPRHEFRGCFKNSLLCCTLCFALQRYSIAQISASSTNTMPATLPRDVQLPGLTTKSVEVRDLIDSFGHEVEIFQFERVKIYDCSEPPDSSDKNQVMAFTDSTTSTNPRHVTQQWLRPEPLYPLPRLQSFERRRASSDGDRRYPSPQNNHYVPSPLNPNVVSKTLFPTDNWSDTAAYGADTAAARNPPRLATVNNPATREVSHMGSNNRAAVGG